MLLQIGILGKLFAKMSRLFHNDKQYMHTETGYLLVTHVVYQKKHLNYIFENCVYSSMLLAETLIKPYYCLIL